MANFDIGVVGGPHPGVRYMRTGPLPCKNQTILPIIFFVARTRKVAKSLSRLGVGFALFDDLCPI